MTQTTRTCDLCGRQCNEWEMYPISIGRIRKYRCPDCYITGMKETGYRRRDKATKRIREEEKGRFR
ncbi:MAG: hypothetical protein IIY21_07660 [Clostridiales bacterium]|nr:hypothetical protein [Clostridiales bacterium]